MISSNSEWMKAIVHVMATTGADWIKEHPHGHLLLSEKTLMLSGEFGDSIVYK